jgi:hypothetical protein
MPCTDPIARALLLMANAHGGCGVAGVGGGGAASGRPSPTGSAAGPSHKQGSSSAYTHSLTMERPSSADSQSRDNVYQQPPYEHLQHRMQHQQQLQQQQQEQNAQQHSDQPMQQENNNASSTMRPSYAGSYIDEEALFQFDHPNPGRNHQQVPPDDDTEEGSSQYVGTIHFSYYYTVLYILFYSRIIFLKLVLIFCCFVAVAEPIVNVTSTESAFNSIFYTITYENQTLAFIDPLVFLYKIENDVISKLKKALKKFKAIKVMLVLSMDAFKAGEKLEFSVKSKNKPLYNQNNLQEFLTSLFESLIFELIAFTFSGSGWSIESPIQLDVHINKFSPLRVGCFVNLPKNLRKKRCLQNLKSRKSDCFKLCILSDYLKPKSSLKRILNQNHINFDCCTEPMLISRIKKFEEKNNLAVCIFGYENSKFFPIRVSSFVNNCDYRKHDLLLLKKGNSHHFVNIRNLNILLRPQLITHRDRIYICRSCFSHHYTELKYQDHVENFCCVDRPHRAVFPKPDSFYPPQTKFTQWKFTVRHGFAIVWDSECTLQETNNSLNFDPKKSTTICVEHHKIIAIACMVISYLPPELCGDIPLGIKTFIGDDAAEQFIYYLNELEPKFLKVLNHNVPLKMSEKDKKAFDDANECELCKYPFNGDTCLKNKDHNHFNGEYRAALCSKCNLLRAVPKTVPLFSHNGQKYDNILILRSLHRLGLGSLRVLQKGSLENFLYIRVKTAGGLSYEFKDSYRLFSAGIANIINSLPQTIVDQVDDYFGPEYGKHARKKNFFPYSYCKNEQELRDCVNPPPQAAFFSQLSGSTLTDDEYAIFLNTWDSLKCRNLMQYLIFYLHVDTILLGIFMKYYQNIVFDQFKLGLFHHLSLPQLSWNQALLFTRCSIHQITDPNIYFAMKRNIKGGLVTCSRSAAISNHPDCPNYDNSKQHTYIAQLDICSQYGSVISEFKLPVANYAFDNDLEKYTLEYIMNWSWELNSGCFLFVDIHLSNKLMDYFNDLPPLSVREKIGEKQEERLILTLESQKNYFCHIFMLQMLITFGLQLVRVRRVIKFEQANFFGPYVRYCGDQRQKTTSKTISDYMKLCSNVIFGRSLFVANSTEVKLYTNAEKAQKQVNKFNFRERIIYSENLISIVLNRKTVRYNSALLVGNSILEISKVLLYSIYYNHLKFKLKDCNLLYSDTDSCLISFICDNLFEEYKKLALVETSNFPVNHPYYSPTNKKRLGFLEDEANGKLVHMYIGLTNKTYMVSYVDNSLKIRSKGIPKKLNLRAKDYINCLITNEKKYVKFFRIDRRRLDLKTLLVNKLSLSTLNEKRVYKDGVESFAPGHWRIKYENFDVPRVIPSKLYECFGLQE